jgi:hypothetical protein
MKKTILNIKPIDWSGYAQMDWEQLRQDIRDEYGNKSLLTTYNDKRLYGRRIKFSTHPNVNRDEIIGFIKGRGYKAERHPQGYILIHLGSPDPNS